jgi:hypothetical protein
MQGQESKQSGRAQQVAQQAGVMQLGPVLDNLRHWQHRVMVAVWNRVKQFWTEETWIRVTDNENTRFVALNQKMTQGELVIKKAKESGASPEQLQQLVQQMAQDPSGMQEVVINGTAQMDVDIVIDEAPDTVTLQSEQWLQLTELAKNGVPIKPETLIKASSLRNKDELVDDIEQQQKQGGVPPQVQEEIKKIGEELQKKGEELAKQEQALQQEKMNLQQQAQQLQMQAQEASAKTQQEAMSLEATRAQFKAEVTIAKAELTAQQKVFAADVQVANANLKAEDAAENQSESTHG